MQSAWQVASLCVLSRTSKPLYSRVFLQTPRAPHRDEGEESIAKAAELVDDTLALQFLMYATQDVFDEKVRAHISDDARRAQMGGPATAGPDRRYFDQLLQVNGYAAHGFESSSHVRVILVIKGEAPRDSIRKVLSVIYDLVSAALCNPFHASMDSQDLGAEFGKKVVAVLSSLLPSHP